MKVYEVGIIMRFHANDPQHAVEQFSDSVIGSEWILSPTYVTEITDEEK